MDLDAQLEKATQKAIEAAKRLNHSQWPQWADNVPIFTLCRHLAEVTEDLDADDLQPYLLAFWNATQEPPDQDEAWEQFADLWDHKKARLPTGNLALIAARRAQTTQDPDWAKHYRPALRFLVRVCIELARMRQDFNIFYLSQPDAAKILNCTQQTAGRMLHILCRDLVLMIKDKPPQGTRKAIKYKLMKPYPSYQNVY